MTRNKRLQKILLITIVLLLSVGCDQVTKVVAREQLAAVPPTSYAGDIFRLHYSENPGAFLSLGAVLPETVRFWIFSIGSGAILLGLFIYTLISAETRLWPTLAYSLVVGGGIGNLIDRFLNNGAVVDFMNIGLGNLRTGIFNGADVAITSGVILLLVLGLRRDDEPLSETVPTTEPAQTSSGSS